MPASIEVLVPNRAIWPSPTVKTNQAFQPAYRQNTGLPSPRPEGVTALRAAVVHDFSQTLSLEGVPGPDPGDDEVVVEIEACGPCHTPG